MTTNGRSHQFAAAVFAALESPETVDRNGLLCAASGFLDALLLDALHGDPGNPEGREMARHIAHAACSFAVLGGSEHYARLARAAEAFRMRSILLNH